MSGPGIIKPHPSPRLPMSLQSHITNLEKQRLYIYEEYSRTDVKCVCVGGGGGGKLNTIGNRHRRQEGRVMTALVDEMTESRK